MPQHIVIIGNGISGITCARHIRKQSNDEITIISSESEHFYSRTALMYIYMGHMKYEHTKPYEDWFWKKNKLKLVKDHVVAIDIKEKKINFQTGTSLNYDKLVIASGSVSNRPPFPGMELKGVQSLYGGKIYKVNTPWDIKFINIGGKKYDLNNIEHGILRKKYNDPRIHFALVCAAVSCPRLRNEAYTAAQLNAQLDDAGKEFLNDRSKNRVNTDKAELSKYFSWYGGDFTKNGSLADYINKYSDTKINSKTRISYLDYNWSINEQK